MHSTPGPRGHSATATIARIPSSSEAGNPRRSGTSVGATAGISVGCAMFVSLFFVGIIVLRKRHVRRQEEDTVGKLDAEPTPFNTAASYASEHLSSAVTYVRARSMRKIRFPSRNTRPAPTVTSVGTSIQPPTQIVSDRDVQAIPELLTRLIYIMSNRLRPIGLADVPPEYDAPARES